MGITYKIRRIFTEVMNDDRYNDYVNWILGKLEDDPDIRGNFEIEGELHEREKHGKYYHYYVDITIKDLKNEHKLRAQSRRNAVDLIARARLLEACADRKWGSYHWDLMDENGAVIKEVENAPPLNRMTTLFPNNESTSEVVYTLQREKQRRTSEKAIPKIIEFWTSKLAEKGLTVKAQPVKPREYQGGWLENLELTVMSDGASINREALDAYMGELCASNRWQGNPYLIVDLENGVGVDINEIPESSEDEEDSDLLAKYRSIIPFDVACSWDDLQDILPELERIHKMKDDEIEAHPAFEGVYGLGAHIRLLMDSIIYAIKTKGEVRNNCLLFGPSGTGKSTLIEHFKKVLPDNSYIAINADSATSAGFRKVFLKILSQTGVPPFLFLEEVEKKSEDTFAPFLSVFDTRGFMQQLNYRDAGKVEAKVFGIFTVNNVDKFDRLLEGAFSNRVTKRLAVMMPNDTILRRILIREVKEHNLNDQYVDAAMEVADELHRICKAPKDPRTVKGYLVGGDRLLDGSYLADEVRVHTVNSVAQSNGYASDDTEIDRRFRESMRRLLLNPDAGD